MKKITCALALCLAGCNPGLMVNGFITDAATGRPVGTCQVRMAKYYAHSDPAGHYSIKVSRKLARKERMKFICEGYETKEVDAGVWRTKSLELDLNVTPTSRN